MSSIGLVDAISDEDNGADNSVSLRVKMLLIKKEGRSCEGR